MSRRFGGCDDERLGCAPASVSSHRVCALGGPGMAHCHDVIPDKSEFGNFLSAGLSTGRGWGILGENGWAAEQEERRALGGGLACVDKSSLHLV